MTRPYRPSAREIFFEIFRCMQSCRQSNVAAPTDAAPRRRRTLTTHPADMMRFWEPYDVAHWYHLRVTLNWERTLLLCDAPNLYQPQPAITDGADDTLYINAVETKWPAQDFIIGALSDAIAESETRIGGERDEARRHECRATLRQYMGHGDDCWVLALREELLRAYGAMRSLPTDTAAQWRTVVDGCQRLTMELQEMDWIWTRLHPVTAEDHGMLRTVCAAEMELEHTTGAWQEDGHSRMAAAHRRFIVAAAGAANFRVAPADLAPAAFGNILASSGFEGLIDDVISIIGQHQHLRGHARGDLDLRLRDRRGD